MTGMGERGLLMAAGLPYRRLGDSACSATAADHRLSRVVKAPVLDGGPSFTSLGRAI